MVTASNAARDRRRQAAKFAADAACRRAGILVEDEEESTPEAPLPTAPVVKKKVEAIAAAITAARGMPSGEDYKAYLRGYCPGIEKFGYDHEAWRWDEFERRKRAAAVIAESPGRSAPASSYEHLTIEGSDEFKAAVNAALTLLRPLPSWRYMAGLSRIASDNSDAGWHCARTRTCFIGPTVAHKRSAKYLASFIVHEGAHGLDTKRREGRQYLRAAEVVAFSAQLAALRELAASPEEIARCERCLANPLGHYSEREIAALTSGDRRKKVAAVLLGVILIYIACASLLMMTLLH